MQTQANDISTQVGTSTGTMAVTTTPLTTTNPGTPSRAGGAQDGTDAGIGAVVIILAAVGGEYCARDDRQPRWNGTTRYGDKETT